MTNAEAISLIEQLKAEIEWDLSLEYQTALETAISSLERDEIGLTDTVKQIHDGVYAEAERKTIDKILNHIRELQTKEMPVREMMGICRVGEFVEHLKEQE